MKFRSATAVTVMFLGVTFCTPASIFAQNHRKDHHELHDSHDKHHGSGYVRHDEWRRGARMNHNDWNRGAKFDYRAYHLSAPPGGYEWRNVDGNYVMAAVATGVIASIIVASAH